MKVMGQEIVRRENGSIDMEHYKVNAAAVRREEIIRFAKLVGGFPMLITRAVIKQTAANRARNAKIAH